MKLLVSLNLEDNNLNDREGVSIVQLLPYLPKLRELCLRDNCLQDSTATALACFATLKILPALTDLHLRDNFMTWRGAEELNYALVRNLFPTLAVLTIGLNRINPINMSRLYATQATLRSRGHAMYLDNDAYDHDSDGVSDESGL